MAKMWPPVLKKRYSVLWFQPRNAENIQRRICLSSSVPQKSFNLLETHTCVCASLREVVVPIGSIGCEPKKFEYSQVEGGRIENS